MSNQIEFTDCEHCGKRIRTTASHCHRCGMKHVAASSKLSSARRGDEEGFEEIEDPTAREESDPEDDADFDYEAFVQEEFGNRNDLGRPSGTKRWIWLTAWILIISFSIPAVIYPILWILFEAP